MWQQTSLQQKVKKARAGHHFYLERKLDSLRELALLLMLLFWQKTYCPSMLPLPTTYVSWLSYKSTQF